MKRSLQVGFSPTELQDLLSNPFPVLMDTCSKSNMPLKPSSEVLHIQQPAPGHIHDEIV